jgi:Uncharacterized protein conserved in bacteria C-term(DUF2220)
MAFPWRHELGWAASLPALSDEQMRDLAAINSWLTRTDGADLTIVPVRYRSVEVFGDEKRLDALERTRLFGPGRLSLELLACVRIPPPLPAGIVGDGPDALIVENSDTYWTATKVLRSSRSHTIGVVAWGSGLAFPSQVASLLVDLAGQGPVTGRVWYWGDLDPAGVDIAVAAANAATQTGGPPILPAARLWAAMAERRIQDVGAVQWKNASAKTWFGTHLWDQLEPVRKAAGRVAQESVPTTAIADWASAGLLGKETDPSE